MKHLWVAAAAFSALVGHVSAQSNVVMYGLLDAGVGQRYTAQDVGMVSNYSRNSRWGLRGSEDLGNGLKAEFNLESGVIDMGTGAIGGNGGFNRQAYVGLSSHFGSLMIGRMSTPEARSMAVFDLNDSADGSSPLKFLGLAADGSLGGSSRQNNQFQYSTPNFGGFDARLGYVFKDDRGGSPNRSFLQASGRYATGDLIVGAAVQSKISSLPGNRTGYTVGAKYDFKVVAISGLYKRRETELAGRGFGLGAAVPIGKLTAGVQAARLSNSSNPMYSKATAYELFGNYALSRRTTLYAAYGSMNESGQLLNGSTHPDTGARMPTPEGKTYGLGVVHRF